MAAITVSKRSTPKPGGQTVIQFYGTSAAASADTFTTPQVEEGGDWKLIEVDVVYSNTPTFTGTALTITKDSALGAGYDTLLSSGTDNSRYTVYLPTGDIRLLGRKVGTQAADGLVIAVPSGGGALTAAVCVTLIQE